MATLILGGLGAVAGGFLDPLNPAAGASLGFSVGVMAAGVMFPPTRKDQSGHPLADLRIHGSGIVIEPSEHKARERTLDVFCSQFPVADGWQIVTHATLIEDDLIVDLGRAIEADRQG